MVFAVFALPILLRLVKKKRAAGLSLFSLFSHRCFSVSHPPCAVTSIYQYQLKHSFHIVTSHSRLKRRYLTSRTASTDAKRKVNFGVQWLFFEIEKRDESTTMMPPRSHMREKKR